MDGLGVSLYPYFKDAVGISILFFGFFFLFEEKGGFCSFY